MKAPLKLMVLSLFLASTVILAGCGEAKKKEPAATPTAPATDGDHDHEEGEDHDHAAGDEKDNAAETDKGAAKAAPAEEATASYTPKMSEDGESQMVSLNLPNMT